MRATHPATQLADVHLAIAQEYGFPSWRALKAEIDRRRAPNVAEFLRACAAGDVETLRRLLENAVRRVARNRLRIGPIEAIDGTPVVDVKPVLAGVEDF